MVTLYVSYHKDDAALAKALKDALPTKVFDVRLDAGGAADDERRAVPNDDLASSDVVVVLLSEQALASHYVLAELGAARALKQARGMCIVPVIVGDMRVPQVVADLSEARVRNAGSQQEAAVAAKVIEGEMKRQLPRLPQKWPAIFISHSHKDKEVAEALTELLDANFSIGKGDIRCTSVAPYQLTTGENTPERLRAEVIHAKVVLGIVTPDTKESSYVMFELGASWGQQVPAWPLLARGAKEGDVPAPLRNVNYVQLSDEGECRKLVNDLSDKVSLERREDAAERVPKKASVLAGLARPDEEREEGAGAAAKRPAAKKRPVKKRAPKKSAKAETARARKPAKKGAKKGAKKSAKKNASAAVNKKLRDLLRDPEYPNGRYLSTLCKKTRLSKSECRERLRKIGARQVELRRGEGWRLKRGK